MTGKIETARRHLKRDRIADRDGDVCHYCKARPGLSRLTLDHVVPRSKGGSNLDDNLVLACTACNGAKGDTMPGDLRLHGRRQANVDAIERAGRRVLYRPRMTIDTPLRLGKAPATRDARDLKLSTFVNLERVIPSAPPAWDHSGLVTDWQMLGNDTVGDCTCAGACHEHMLWTAEAGRQAMFTAEDALELYGAVTGYNPADPSTDRGANVRDVLNYRRQTGVTDDDGNVHKIDGYLSLRLDDVTEWRVAAYVFGAVGLGFAFPDYAMDQFREGKAWVTISGRDLHPNEGHYVPWVGYDHHYLDVVTWGKVQKMSWAFAHHYVDEAWAIYSRDALAASGRTIDGFDQAALDDALAAL